MASLIGPSRVDWDVVDEELDRVPEEFKDPRFDSLRHVLDILSAVDAEAALEELKSQHERIEQLVDNVVQGYHSGFNKSIHNYSQILHLFSVSKDQVNKLRSQLEDAQRRLTSQSHSLEIQWKRSVTLGDTVKLLADIRGLAQLPHRVQKLQEAKDWSGAVAALFEGCGRLARAEYAGIGALKEIKREVASIRNSLIRYLVAEVEKAVFENLALDWRQADSMGHPIPSFSSQHPVSGANGRASPVEGRSPKTAPLGSVKSLAPARSSGSRDSPSWRKPQMSTQCSLSGRAALLGNSDTEHSCKELIDCISRLGGASEMQAALRRHLPVQIKRVMLRALEGCRNGRKPTSTTAEAWGKRYAIHPATAEAAAMLVERSFDSYLQVIQNLVSVLWQIGAAKSPASSAGLSLLLASKAPDSQGPPPASGSAYVRREVDFAWECMQKEVQALLTELVQPGSSSANLAGFGSVLPGTEGSKLSFSFDVELQGVAARVLLQRENSLGKWEGDDMAALARSALWGFAGSPYLTPHIYQPTKDFVEDATFILGLLDKDSDAGAVWFGGGDRSESRQALRLFVSNFVENAFMPTLFMDFKTRCAEVLDDPESMRARAKPQAVYSAEASKGRALLPAVRVVETCIEELLQWGALMPPFATRMTGVLENMLGKVFAAFQTRVTELLGSATCRALSEDPTLALQMAEEPAANQAGDPVAFFVGRNSDSVDNFVASILQTGFGNGGDVAEVNILHRILQERPVKASALLTIADTSRIMNLAAAADSLDYLADTIQSCVTRRNNLPIAVEKPGSPGGAEAALSAPASKANTLGLDSLEHLVDRYRSLAGQSLRALRLDMLLLVAHHLESLPKGRYVCEAAEAQDVDECIGALQRSSSRADEAVAPFLPPEKRAYVFGGMAAAAARFVMWLLPELKAVNQAGLARMCRMLAVLQPFLAALGSAGGLFRPEAARHLERARAYYAHLTYSQAALVAAATARPTRFTPKEYMALLEVDFVGRAVDAAHKAEMAKIVSAAAKKHAKATSRFTRA